MMQCQFVYKILIHYMVIAKGNPEQFSALISFQRAMLPALLQRDIIM